MGPFTLPVSVFSTILEYELTPQKGWMELQYTLDLGRQPHQQPSDSGVSGGRVPMLTLPRS